MGRRAPLASLLVLALAAAAGCVNGLRVEFDPLEDFARYRTWDWLPKGFEQRAASRELAPDLDALLRAAIERELAARGFERAGDDAPDFYVSYHADLKLQLVRGTETPAMRTLSSLHHTPSYEITAPATTLRRYDVGTLALDVADGRDRQLVWRGIQTGRWRNGVRDRVDGLIADLFERFPPPPDAASGDGRG
jgi:hypothetical protein